MTPTPKQQRQVGKVTGAIVTAPFAAAKAVGAAAKYGPKVFKAVKTAWKSPGKTAATLATGAVGAGTSELKNYAKDIYRHASGLKASSKEAGETAADIATKSKTTKPKKDTAKRITVTAKPKLAGLEPAKPKLKPKQKKGKWV